MGFPCDSAGKESACNVGDVGSSPGWEDPREKGKVTHSSTLAWRVPWTLQSMASQRFRQDSSDLAYQSLKIFHYFLIGGKLLNSVMLFSAIHQRESVVIIFISIYPTP